MSARQYRMTIAAHEEREFPRVPLPLDITDETLFPEMAAARRHLAGLSPERRAELERDWENG